MAKFSKYLSPLTYYLLPLTFLLLSCQEGREAGDLFGMWRMKGSDTHFLSFSGTIVGVKDTSKGEVFGNFQHTGDSLFIQCYSIYGDPADTTIVAQSYGFKPINDIRLKIDVLDSDDLVLSKGGQIGTFYKY